ncbi:MAG: DUF4131 domain-containing protein, partial [Caldanaerobacter sp.]
MGILLGRFLLPVFVSSVLLAASVFFLFFVYKKSKHLTSVVLLLPFLFLGALLAALMLHAPNPYEKLEDKFVAIKGKVVEVKEEEERAKYIVKPKNLPKILVLQYGGEYPKKGDVVEVRGIISLPKPSTNPGGFDYQLFLRKKGVYGITRIHPYAVSIEGREVGFFEEILLKAEDRIKKNFLSSMPQKDADFLITSFLG